MIRFPLGAASTVPDKPLACRRAWGLPAPFSIRHRWFPDRHNDISRELLWEDLVAIRCLLSMS